MARALRRSRCSSNRLDHAGKSSAAVEARAQHQTPRCRTRESEFWSHPKVRAETTFSQRVGGLGLTLKKAHPAEPQFDLRVVDRTESIGVPDEKPVWKEVDSGVRQLQRGWRNVRFEILWQRRRFVRDSRPAQGCGARGQTKSQARFPHGPHRITRTQRRNGFVKALKSAGGLFVLFVMQRAASRLVVPQAQEDYDDRTHNNDHLPGRRERYKCRRNDETHGYGIISARHALIDSLNYLIGGDVAINLRRRNGHLLGSYGSVIR